MSLEDDPFDLARFLEAQRHVYSRALSEIRKGQKTSHWMWFIFPQIEGLGNSPNSVRYSIKSVNEARSYLGHPILGTRLIECSNAVLESSSSSAEYIFGDIDTQKLSSSMTLFDMVSADRDSVFLHVLTKYFDGRRDEKTVAILAGLNADKG